MSSLGFSAKNAARSLLPHFNSTVGRHGHSRLKKRLLPLAVIGALGAATAYAGEPIIVATHGHTLFRIQGSSIESFELDSGIHALETIGPAASVAGCATGDVIAIDNADTAVYRLDNARSGIPVLTSLGALPSNGTGYHDIVARGDVIYGIQDSVFSALVSTTFLPVADPSLLDSSETARCGGIAYDGTGNWYLSDTTGNHLVHLNDPPAPEDWTNVDSGDVGVQFNSSDLAWFQGQLWGALEIHDSTSYYVAVGTFNLSDGQFTPRYTTPGTPNNRAVGLAIIDGGCTGDLDGNGGVDLSDLAILLSHFGDTNASPADGDTDGDGDVDLTDLASLLARFGSAC